jgi:hypothetical protein
MNLFAKADPRFQTWQDIYDAILHETNIPKLFALMEILEPTILMRRDALRELPENAPELRAIETALQTLFVVKRNRLNF